MTAEMAIPAMDDSALRQGIENLLADYADCIDDDRLEQWPDFFVDDCRYLITDRESHAAGLRHGVIYCASRGMLIDRVTTMRRVLVYEPHRYRHILGPARIGAATEGVAETRSNFLAVRIMHDGASSLFATGRYFDQIDVTKQPFRFIERLVILDSHKIDTLLVIPL